MPRSKKYTDNAVRVEAYDARLRAAGGRKVTVRLSPTANRAAEAMVERGLASSVTDAVNQALERAKIA